MKMSEMSGHTQDQAARGGVRFVSTGAAIRSRIPVSADGNFPINKTLIGVLALGLAIFNQALFWLLAVLLAGRGNTVTAARFVIASVALGAVLWALLAVLQWRATDGGNAADKGVLVLTAALCAGSVWLVSPVCGLAAVAVLTAWSVRGLFGKPAGA